MVSKINNIDDVKIFTKLIINEGTNVHPDEDFKNYVNLETGEDAYTLPEIELRNELMNQCFAVCEDANEDIYSIMQEIFLLETVLDKFIPLPSDNYLRE